MPQTFRLHRSGGIALTLSDRGATWLACEVPVGAQRRGVVLQRAGIEDASADKAYLGATVGRYANRIGHARIRLGMREWLLMPSPRSRHQLHGGPGGFHACTWAVDQVDDFAICFSLHSPDGDQGFPGEMHAQVVYRLADAMTIEMETTATVTAPSPVAITNHAYFNLDGVSPHARDVRDHRLRIAARHYTQVDSDLIPIGRPGCVQGTSFDFRRAKRIGQDWLADGQQAAGGGYDHAFLLDGQCAGLQQPAVELTSASGDLQLAISTTLPAMQFYAGQSLDSVASPAGQPYPACAGLALEPGYLPDSPNHPEWPQPSCWVMPGETWRHITRYQFRAA